MSTEQTLSSSVVTANFLQENVSFLIPSLPKITNSQFGNVLNCMEKAIVKAKLKSLEEICFV